MYWRGDDVAWEDAGNFVATGVLKLLDISVQEEASVGFIHLCLGFQILVSTVHRPSVAAFGSTII